MTNGPVAPDEVLEAERTRKLGGGRKGLGGNDVEEGERKLGLLFCFLQRFFGCGAGVLAGCSFDSCSSNFEFEAVAMGNFGSPCLFCAGSRLACSSCAMACKSAAAMLESVASSRGESRAQKLVLSGCCALFQSITTTPTNGGANDRLSDARASGRARNPTRPRHPCHSQPARHPLIHHVAQHSHTPTPMPSMSLHPPHPPARQSSSPPAMRQLASTA